MVDLEWKEVKPENKMAERQINLMAFYGEVVLVYLLYQGEEIGWVSVINNREEFLEAGNEEDAKSELLEALYSHCEDEIDYYKSILESLKEIKKM